MKSKIERDFATAIRGAYESKSALLLGNGINRVNPMSLSRDDLLKSLIEKSGLQNVRTGTKPLTFLFEELSHKMEIKEKGATRSNVQQLKEIVRKQIEEKLSSGTIHKEFMKLPIENILTTNYDYCLEKAIDETFSRKNMLNDKPEGPDKKYSLYRCNKVNDRYIWHIHGELDNGLSLKKTYPEHSIMLGFDQYMIYIESIVKYFKSADYKKELEQKESKSCRRAWIPLLFTHNIHIIGLDLGMFETHLWWLLNFRAVLSVRQNCISNKITYYVPSYELLMKRDQLEMLQSLKVDIEEVPCAFNNGNFYSGFYEEVFKKLKKELNTE
ncbi:SIR2 family protein [Parafilimonas sp.]|uniref:SIR2 family protein n=1 Tax=Parafilimonas sp. TaxID=1969739 RepID=UPI0039E4DA79